HDLHGEVMTDFHREPRVLRKQLRDILDGTVDTTLTSGQVSLSARVHALRTDGVIGGYIFTIVAPAQKAANDVAPRLESVLQSIERASRGDLTAKCGVEGDDAIGRVGTALDD